MVSTPKVCTNNIPMTPNPYVSTKNPSAIKSLHKFTDTFDFKHNTSVSRFSEPNAKRKSIKNQCVVIKHCKAPG